MKKLIFAATIVMLLMSCTQNQRAHKLGGTMEVKLKPNEELVNCTWKESNLWILVKDKSSGEMKFREISLYGALEGKVTFE